MSSVYSIRVPKKLKKDIESLDNIDWQNETRTFLEERVRKERIGRQLEVARKNKERMKVTLNVAQLIREIGNAFTKCERRTTWKSPLLALCNIQSSSLIHPQLHRFSSKTSLNSVLPKLSKDMTNSQL